MQERVTVRVELAFEVDEPLTEYDHHVLVEHINDALESQIYSSEDGLCPVDGYTTDYHVEVIE